MFIPPDSDTGATVTTVVSDHDRGHGTGPGLKLGYGYGPVIIKPIVLEAQGGFGSLTGRSRSAPPFPRDQVRKRPPSQSSASPAIEDRSNGESTMLPIEVVDEKVNGLYPDPTVTHPANSVSVTNSDRHPPDIQPHAPMHKSTVPQALMFGSRLVAHLPGAALLLPSRHISWRRNKGECLG